VGQPAHTPPPDPLFCVVGYGKLGGKELAYASDLDVIFLYDDSHSEARRLRAARAAHEHLAHQLHAAGVLYDTDLRLRPTVRAACW